MMAEARDKTEGDGALVVWIGMFALTKTPPVVVSKLHAAALKALATEGLKADFAKDRFDIVTDESTEAFKK